MTSIHLYTREQVIAIEKKALTDYDIKDLMQRAGCYAFQYLKSYYTGARSITVLCGKGNNGGDGLVLALQAYLAGYRVQTLLLTTPQQLQGDARNAYLEAVKQGVVIEQCPDKLPTFTGDLIIDAVLGTGFRGQLRGVYAEAIISMNKSACLVFSLDIPSGLDANTGQIHELAVFADSTLTFIGIKQGLVLQQGRKRVGRLQSYDLSLPDVLYPKQGLCLQLLKPITLSQMLPLRTVDSHKGTYGKLLIIGGDLGGAGAVQMAALAAFAMGVGKVWVATHPKHAAYCDANCLEPIFLGINSAHELTQIAEQVDTVLIGPGIGLHSWGVKLITWALRLDKPLVVDADALNYLANNQEAKKNWVLTPHPAEAGRLLKTDTQSIQGNRLESVRNLVKQFGGVTVLKGNGTLIKTESHACVTLCPYGNSGMATAGTGDILSGMIAALCAQGLSLKQSAELGVYTHALAGDYGATQQGECSLTATDLLKYVRIITKMISMNAFQGKGDVVVL